MDQFKIQIVENPLDSLINCFHNNGLVFSNSRTQTIFLPLYGKDHQVYESSGLNQWNAKGRTRNYGEVYIPIPVSIHRNFPNFFPDRNTPFDLRLPNGKTMKSKICQDGGKALMSQSNKELGEWILRDVLKLKEGELLTYEKLQFLGIDSVRIDKIDEQKYEINFAKSGSYDKFIELVSI